MYLAWVRWILTCASGFLILEVAIAAVAYEATRSTLPDDKYDILVGTGQDSEFKEDISNGAEELYNEKSELSNHLSGNSTWNKLCDNCSHKLVPSLDDSQDEISCREEEEYYFKRLEEWILLLAEELNFTENETIDFILNDEPTKEIISFITLMDDLNANENTEKIFVGEDKNRNYNVPSKGDFLAPKCCRKGEQLDSRISRCIPRPGHAIENTRKELLNVSNNFRDAYWTKFSTQEILYVAIYNKIESLPFVGPILLKRIESESEVHLLSRGNITFSPNHISKCNFSDNIQIRLPYFCFDAVESGPFAPHVFVTMLCDSTTTCIGKCCLPGEMLSKEGLCVPKSETSSFYGKDIRNSSYLLPYSHAPCMENGYDVVDISRSNNYYIKRSIGEFFYYMNGHDLKMRCVDWQEAGDGVVKQVLGTCSLLSNVKLFLSVRPLGIVTVLLLCAAVVVTITRAEMRRSAHGRALASHAFCLMAANSLQVAAFYAGVGPPTYFFLVAGNAWLSSMTLNMLLGFRQPLGALASVSRRSHSEMRKRYALMSVFSWGIAAALTAFTTYIQWNHVRNRAEESFYAPAFAETKICPVDVVSGRRRRDAGTIPMGSLLYFYVPVGLLVFINLLCVLFVILRMRQLKRGNDVLGGAHIGSRQSKLESAFVYVKLLLMAGLVELCLELSSWTRRSTYDEYAFEIEEKYLLENAYSLSITATFVDLSRAVLVLWLCIRQGQKVFWLCKPQCWLDMWKQIRRPIFKETVCGRNDLKKNQDTYL